MLQFHPPGVGQRVIETSLGAIVAYTAVGAPWTPPEKAQPMMFWHSFGGGASAYEWSKVYPAFLNTHRVLAVDLLGWGESAHPVRDYQVDDYLTTLAELMEKTCDRPAIVVAASISGAIAVRLAVQRPELFQALILVCPSGFADFGEGAERRLPLDLVRIPLLNQAIYLVGAMNEVAIRNFLERFLFAKRDRIPAEMVAAYLESARKPNAQYAALSFLQGNVYFDLARYVPQLTTPTAILWGKQAQFTRSDLGRRLASLNPKAIQSVIELPDAGVLPQLEQPAIVIGVMQQLLPTLTQSRTDPTFC